MSCIRSHAPLLVLLSLAACGGGDKPPASQPFSLGRTWHTTFADGVANPLSAGGFIDPPANTILCNETLTYSDLVLDDAGVGMMTLTTTRFGCTDGGASDSSSVTTYDVTTTTVETGTKYTLLLTNTADPTQTKTLDCTRTEATLGCMAGTMYSFAFEGVGIETSATYKRGDYLVNAVLGCSDCHSGTHRLDGHGYVHRATTPPIVAPRLNYQLPSTYYASFVDFDNAVRNGIASPTSTASVLFTDMPYWAYHNMTTEDLNAVFAYLNAVAPDSSGVDSSPTRSSDTVPIAALDAAAVPMPTVVNASTMNGRYLAGLAGACISCHTPESAPGIPDYTKLFAGGRAYDRDLFQLPSTYPTTVYSTNLTPDATGLAGYTQQDIVNVLLNGTDRNGQGICLPMRAGAGSTHGAITASDANDIAAYLLALPPVANAVPADCVAP